MDRHSRATLRGVLRYLVKSTRFRTALAICLVLAAASVAWLLVSFGPTLAGAGQSALVVVALIAFAGYFGLQRAEARNARIHGLLTGCLHFVSTNALSVGYAWIMYTRNADRVGFDATGDAFKHWMLATAFVGGALALFRSTGTHSIVQATLGTSVALKEQIEELRAKVLGNDGLFELALRAYRSQTTADLGELLYEMVRVAVRLPDTSREVDGITLWVREGGLWMILMGENISDLTKTGFQQPVIEQERPGAGLVANMAAAREHRLVVERGVQDHPWFKDDPDAARPMEGFAGVLISDQAGEPIGALCLTTGVSGALVADPQARERLVDVLRLWSAAFTLPLERLQRLRKDHEDGDP